MNSDILRRAKSQLPLSDLMRQLGLGDHARKSARCPFHEDSSASFSVYVGDDGEERWKCFAGCGHGDAIGFLAKHRGINNHDACREYIQLAGIHSSPLIPMAAGDASATLQKFDWPACVSALTAEHREAVAKWRGYSLGFVEWMHQNRLLGRFKEQHVALPVHAKQGAVVGCHYRLTTDGSWRYHPAGTHTAPFIIGQVAAAKIVFAFESQWDLLALLDRLLHHSQPLADTAAIATRGASNARLLSGACRADAILYAFAQNDVAGRKWLASIATTSTCTIREVMIPPQFKDLNDWTIAGASRQDIETAIAAAQPYRAQEGPDSSSNPVDPGAEGPQALPDEPDDDVAPAPFPTECLPPKMALMVKGVAKANRVPEALPGTMALATVAASCGKGLVLDWRPGRAPTPANLFVIVSAASGSGKSECFKAMMKAFHDFERNLQARWRREVMPKLQADLRFHEGQLKRIDRELLRPATASGGSERLRGELVFHQSKVEQIKALLHEPQLSIQDATVEKVATVMHLNDEIIFSNSADARKPCDNLLGRYAANKKLADDSIYLSAFSGDDVKVDRQGREGVRLSNPCMTLLWALQPDALDMLLDEDSLQHGGFLARCLFAHTLAEPQHIGGATTEISATALAGWESLIHELLMAYRQPRTAGGASTSDELADRSMVTHVIGATTEARQRLESYFNEIVDRRRAGELLDVSQYASRWCEQAARLAITLHAGLHGGRAHQMPLESETVEMAVTLAKWFANQQLNLLEKGRRAAARKVELEVLELIERNQSTKSQDFTTAREVHRNRIAATAEGAKALLARMEAEGLVVGEDTRPAHGGKVTRIYRAVGTPLTD